MKKFTQDNVCPSEKKIQIIKQIAYSYRTFKENNKNKSYCLN